MSGHLRQSRRGGRRILAALACAVLALVLIAAGPAEARRLALIVGNADYRHVSPLNNAVNDARAMSDALERLGFEVTLLTDPGSTDFRARLDAFGDEAEGADSVLFFYSGHAFQMNGVNYLVPVDAELASRDAVLAETWNLDGIIARLQDRGRQTLIFLDACRDDPLPAPVRGSGGTADGLARIQTGTGTFVAFATEPGAVSYDGGAGAVNSPFTAALLEHLETPGLSVSDLMINVRNDVEEATLDLQTPWDQSSLRSQFYFSPVEETRQGLSAADYELLAQFSPEDRLRFLDVLRASGFSEQAIAEAEAAIAAAASLEVVADGGLEIGIGTPETGDPVAVAEAPAAPEPVAVAEAREFVLPEFDIVDETVQIGDVPEIAPDAAPAVAAEIAPEIAVAEAPAEIPAPRPAARPADLAPDLAPGPTSESAGMRLAGAPDPAPVPVTQTPVAEAPVTQTIAEAAPEPAAVPTIGTLTGGGEPVRAPVRPDEAEAIRIAALTGETRGINGITALTVDRLRVAGAEVRGDSEEGRALLARIDPRLVTPETAPADDTPADIARAVQAELQRLGCYTMRVDGAWGPGSRAALTSYYLAKKTVPDSLEPDAALWRRLTAEPQVVCETRVARTAPRGTRQQAAPAAAAPAAGGTRTRARQQQAAPQPQQRIERALIGVGSF